MYTSALWRIVAWEYNLYIIYDSIIYRLCDAMTVLVNRLLYTELLKKKEKTTADQPLAAP